MVEWLLVAEWSGQFENWQSHLQSFVRQLCHDSQVNPIKIYGTQKSLCICNGLPITLAYQEYVRFFLLILRHIFSVNRFAIKNGEVTYQCRFIHTDSYKKNCAANRTVVTSFGTSPVSDPCQTIFQRVASLFQPGTLTDNTMISIYPFGDEYYAFTECPVIQRYRIFIVVICKLWLITTLRFVKLYTF